ncbi:MAG: winged helix-turn-helix domain-containing protein [Deltaproteobacteria bacterium]|nr:MAG: winged helix-turn-helix domain-containing protein [Deltaproteobacteria bacterium]
MGITQKELARRMGVTPQAVNKRVKAGRLSVLADGTLDPDVVMAEWNAGREPDGAPRVERPAAPEARAQALPPSPPVRTAQAPPGPAPGTYAQAKTADTVYRARLRQLEYETKSGTYLKTEDVAKRWYDVAAALRARFMAIPSRLAAELAALDDVHEVRLRLDSEIRTALQELARNAQ